MIKITNKSRSPIQLIIRSKKLSRSFTTLAIKGLGSGKNTYYLEDERKTDYIDRVEKMGLITTQHIPNKIKKGDA